MTDSQVLRGNRTPTPNTFLNQLTRQAAENCPAGTPVCVTDNDDPADTVSKAQADDVNTASVIGLYGHGTDADGEGPVLYCGPLSLSEAEWDAITGGSGGLSRGEQYYLSAATAGRITTTAPVGEGNFVVPVGVAVSSTCLMIQCSAPTAL